MTVLMRAAAAHVLGRNRVGVCLVSDPMGLFQLPTTTAPFEDVVAKLGVAHPLVSCRAQYCRDLFWSSYPDPTEDWRDQWYAHGRIELTLGGPVPDQLDTLADDDGIKTMGDGTVASPSDDDRVLWSVTASFADPSQLVAARTALMEDPAFAELRDSFGSRFRLHQSTIFDIRMRVHGMLLCDVGMHGPEFYESGMSIRQLLLDALEQHGGATHHHGLL